jgi:AcrR family transcriptional regulator
MVYQDMHPPMAAMTKHKSEPIKLSRRQLYRLIWSKPLATVADELGLSTNGLSKICDRVGVPYPPRGYWARQRAGRAPDITPLPEISSDEASSVSFTKERSPSRRTRSRMSPAERREQLVEAGRRLILRDGLHQMSMKRLAREVGISEAMAHNYFTRDALLTELARRELDMMESARRADIEQASDIESRALLGTLRYLREVERRGALIQILLTDPAVRAALRQERRVKSEAGMGRLTGRLEAEHGVPPAVSRIVGRVLTAVSLRAGRLLASGKIDLPQAEKLVTAIVVAGNARMIETWGAKRKLLKTDRSSKPPSSRRAPQR